MKKLLIPAIVLAVAGIATMIVSMGYTREAPVVQFTTPAPVPKFGIEDTAGIFDIKWLTGFKGSPQKFVEAYRLMDAMDTLPYDDDRRIAMLSHVIRLYPLPSAYYSYAAIISARTHSLSAEEMIRSLAGVADEALTGAVYISGAEYALRQGDTSMVLKLLVNGFAKDTTAYRLVKRNIAFRALENNADYYYLMDSYLQDQSGMSSAMRTMYFTSVSPVPYELSMDRLYDKVGLVRDATTGSEYVPRILSDDAMGDLVRGKRTGRFSRETDRTYKFVAKLHLSDSFTTFIYEAHYQVNEGDEEYQPSTSSRKTMDGKLEMVAMRMQQYSKIGNFYLGNFDKQGKKLGEQKIACTCSPIHISTGAIDSTGLIQVRDMEQQWAKDPLKVGYRHNEVTSSEVTGVKYYQVKEDGTIVPATATDGTADHISTEITN